MAHSALTPEQLAEIRQASLPRVALQPDAACAVLDMSLSSFQRYVQPDVRCIRKGSLRLYLVRELQQWAEDNATPTFE
jgi:hypothetical protein